MTVAELIAELQRYSPHAPVYIEPWTVSNIGEVPLSSTVPPASSVTAVSGALGYGPLITAET